MITRNGRNGLDDLDENVPRGADDSDGSEYSYQSADDSDDGFVEETAPSRRRAPARRDAMSTSDGSARAAFGPLDGNVPPRAGASDDKHAGAPAVAAAAPRRSKPSTATPRAVPPPSPTSTEGASRAHKPAWYSSEQHLAERQRTAAEIEQLLRSRKPNPTADWLQQLPGVAQRLEGSLLRSALSFREYSDPSTLKKRLQGLAAALSRRTEQPVPPPVPTSPGGASPARAPDHRGHVQNDDSMRPDDRDADAHDADAAEAAAAADAEDVPPDAAPDVDLSQYTLQELLEPLPQARLVRGAHGHPVFATSRLGLAAAANAFAATRTPPRGGQHGGAWRQDTDPRRYFLVETVANSACPVATAVSYLKHGGEHSSRALCSLVVDAFVNSPMFAGKDIALVVPCPHDDETAAKGYSPYDLAVKVEQHVDGVTVLKGVVHHDEAIGRPESGATPSKRCEFYDRRRPTVEVAMLKALRPGTIVGIIDIRTRHYSKIGALVRELHSIVVTEGLQLTIASFVVSQDISSGSPANDVTPEIFRALDDAARLDLHEHGPTSPAGAYFDASYIVTDASLKLEQLPVVYAGSAASRTRTPPVLSPALLAACKSGTAASIARAAEPLLQPRATEHTRGLMQGKKSPAFRVMWDHLCDAYGQDTCVGVAMDAHLIAFNEEHETKEELVRLCGLPNEDALIRVVELLVASVRRRPFHLIIDRESGAPTQAARCAQRTSRRPRPLLSAGASRTQTCPAILWCRMGTRSRTRRRASISAVRPSPRGPPRNRCGARVEDPNTPYASRK